MTYRESEFQPMCFACGSLAANECRNCLAPGCDAHLKRGACKECTAHLGDIEDDIFAKILLGYVALFIPLGAASALLARSSMWMGTSFGVAILVSFIIFGITGHRLIRRAIRDRRLPQVKRAPKGKASLDATVVAAQVATEVVVMAAFEAL